LSLFWKRFTPLEEQLLSEVRKVIPVEGQPVFDAQVRAINHVQRMPLSWGEIDFYCRPNWTRVPIFPCTDEFRLAQVKFRIAGRAYKATLSCINGHIFDFAITPGPRNVAFEPWEEGPATAYRVVIDDAQYLILAEREGPQFILYRVEPSGDGLYYLKHHDGIPSLSIGILRSSCKSYGVSDHPGRCGGHPSSRGGDYAGSEDVHEDAIDPFGGKLADGVS